MTNSYRYVQRYRPSTANRVPGLVSFIRETLVLLGDPPLFDDEDNQIECTESTISELVQKAKQTMPAGLGASIDLFAGTASTENISRYELGVGTTPGKILIDFYGLQFSPTASIDPFWDSNAIKALLSIEVPFEAFLAENNNEWNLNAKQRQNKIPGFSRPALIRGVHYLGQEMVDNLGGLEKCLKSPAHTAEPFRGGVLLRLVQGVFDPANPSHLAVQSGVMDYFGM